MTIWAILCLFGTFFRFWCPVPRKDLATLIRTFSAMDFNRCFETGFTGTAGEKNWRKKCFRVDLEIRRPKFLVNNPIS
jgi:hypothetical protein